MTYQVLRMEVTAAEEGYGIEEVLDHKELPQEFATRRAAVKFIEKTEGVTLEDIGEGYWRIEGETKEDGERMTMWLIEKVVQNAA